MRRAALLLAVGALVAAVAAPTATAARRAPVRLDGSIRFQIVFVERDCLFADAGEARVQECARRGTFVGSRRRGVASYAWHWHLELGAGGAPTGRADEDGHLVVRLGMRGTARLRTRGQRRPLGPQGSERAVARTTGRWTYVAGTRTLGRRRGSGTFVFETETRGGTMTARLVLRGTLR